MSTKREMISRLRNKLREVSADSLYFPKFLFSVLKEHATWIIRREWSSNRIFRNKALFQRIPCINTVEVSKIDPNCLVGGKNVYRTECQLPELWQSELGVIIKRVSSLDNHTEFKVLSWSEWENKSKSPYLKMTREKYCYEHDRYIYFPQDHPRKVSIEALIIGSANDICDCGGEKACVRFLDTPFGVPEWVEAEIIDKAVQQLLGQTSRVQNDENINSNNNIRN